MFHPWWLHRQVQLGERLGRRVDRTSGLWDSDSLPPPPLPFLGSRGRQYQGLWSQLRGDVRVLGMELAKRLCLPAPPRLERASQGGIILADGRLTVQGGAKFAFELENRCKESVSLPFPKMLKPGEMVFHGAESPASPKASQSVAPRRELLSNGKELGA